MEKCLLLTKYHVILKSKGVSIKYIRDYSIMYSSSIKLYLLMDKTTVFVEGINFFVYFFFVYLFLQTYSFQNIIISNMNICYIVARWGAVRTL